MGQVELYHPVTEEKAREYVDATYVPDGDLTEDQQNAQKDARVANLLESAAHNQAWRNSRNADEQVAMANQPFASSPDNAFTGEENE